MKPQQQNGDQPFTYAVAANDTGAARTGTITFTSATGGLVATLDRDPAQRAWQQPEPLGERPDH